MFKDPTYNEAPHVIGLVKYTGNYDGLSSIPTLMNRSYYCRHCDQGYNTQDAQHHNCDGQNCSACYRQNKTCPNFATWVKPTVHCPDCHCVFYGQDCFQVHKTKGKKRGDESICDRWKKCPLCLSVQLLLAQGKTGRKPNCLRASRKMAWEPYQPKYHQRSGMVVLSRPFAGWNGVCPPRA